MKNTLVAIYFSLLCFIMTASCLAEVADTTPVIGYLLPAGGQRGTSVEVMVVGSRFTKNFEVLLSDPRIKATVIHVHEKMAFDPPRGEERQAINKLVQKAKNGQPVSDELRSQLGDWPILWPVRNSTGAPDPRDIRRVEYEFIYPRQRVKPSREFTQTVRVRVDIPSEVPTGKYEIRIRNKMRTSRPLYFQVGDCPEILEAEPCTPDGTPVDPALKLPVCVNGQIYPGDEDIYQFYASEGQKVSIHAQARELKPYIADGVPGWFEALITLFDPEGNEVAYSDCTQFRPDPTIVYRAKRGGIYTLKLRDSIYRGREDFVYRLTFEEYHPVKKRKFAHVIKEPRGTNTHDFEGKKGQDVVIRTAARVHGSPIDTYLQVVDSNGNIVAENDDFIPPFRVGLQTAYTDSYLRFTPPEDGTYHARVSDTSQMGGPDYGYDIFLNPPNPRFFLYVTPSTLDIFEGQSLAVTFHAIRLDGFNGPINIKVKKGGEGFRLDGATIPMGENTVSAVITATGREGTDIVEFVGSGRVDGKKVSAKAIPAEDWQQAFLYRHLVPGNHFQIYTTRGRMRPPTFSVQSKSPVQFKSGESVSIQLKSSLRKRTENLDFRLQDAPDGVSLEQQEFENGKLTLSLASEKDIDSSGNLIVEVLMDRTIKSSKGEKKMQIPIGVLPPIPYQ